MERDELYNLVSRGEMPKTAAFPILMRKVYVWMTLALIITGMTAFGFADTGLIYTLFQSQSVLWGLVIAEFALVFILTGAINRLSLPVATMMFIIYSMLNGVMISSIFIAYTAESITSVFFITASTFGAMAAIGYCTKTDLTSMGKILLMALIGIIIATVVNMFVHSSGLQLICSYAGVLIFVGLTAYDSQKIKHMLLECDDVNDMTQKLAVLGALTLYLDFLNLFLYLLKIFGNKRD